MLGEDQSKLESALLDLHMSSGQNSGKPKRTRILYQELSRGQNGTSMQNSMSILSMTLPRKPVA